MHMSSSGNYNVLSNATGCPNGSKDFHREVFQHAESKLAIRICSLSPPGTQALRPSKKLDDWNGGLNSINHNYWLE